MQTAAESIQRHPSNVSSACTTMSKQRHTKPTAFKNIDFEPLPFLPPVAPCLRITLYHHNVLQCLSYSLAPMSPESRHKIDIWIVSGFATTLLVVSLLLDTIQTVSANVLCISTVLPSLHQWHGSVCRHVYPPPGLKSSMCQTYVVPRTCRKLGERVFSVSGPVAWNALPANIRNTVDVKLFKWLLPIF